MKKVEQFKNNLNQTTPSYAQVLKSNTNTCEKVNSTNYHENKPKKSINERLRSLSPANRKPKQGIIWSRNNSKTDLSSNYDHQPEIETIKKNKKLNYWNKERTIIKKKQEIKTSNTRTNSKNEFQASVFHGGQEENIELINVINFIEQTMATLSSNGKRLKISIWPSRTSNQSKYQKILQRHLNF